MKTSNLEKDQSLKETENSLPEFYNNANSSHDLDENVKINHEKEN
jgi:hypothetical protein